MSEQVRASTVVYSRSQVALLAGGLSSGRHCSALSQVLGLLVWALIADTPYHLYPAYGWVMFVAVFLWLVTIVFFILYLLQLHLKWYTVPWPLVVSLGGGWPGCRAWDGGRVALVMGITVNQEPKTRQVILGSGKGEGGGMGLGKGLLAILNPFPLGGMDWVALEGEVSDRSQGQGLV